MRRVKTAGWLLSLLMAAAMVTNAFITPGLRHQHEEGHVAHSHHGHYPPHSHRHPHPSSDHPRRPSDTRPSTAHVHLTLFGFELTLPDVFGTKDAPISERDTVTVYSGGNAKPHGLLLRRPTTSAEIVQFLMQVRMLRPAHVEALSLPAASLRTLCEPAFGSGRDRPAPPVPPPRTVHVA